MCIRDSPERISRTFVFQGYLHEQSRSDRDEYVTINWNNMNSAYESAFAICLSCDLQDTEYDYQSVMHYSSWAFSNNGQDTIVKKDGESIDSRAYTQLGLSCLDIVGINKHYTCGNLFEH